MEPSSHTQQNSSLDDDYHETKRYSNLLENYIVNN